MQQYFYVSPVTSFNLAMRLYSTIIKVHLLQMTIAIRRPQAGVLRHNDSPKISKAIDTNEHFL